MKSLNFGLATILGLCALTTPVLASEINTTETVLEGTFYENAANEIAPDQNLLNLADSLNCRVLVFETEEKTTNSVSLYSLDEEVVDHSTIVVDKNIYLIPEEDYSSSIQRSAYTGSGSGYIVSNAAKINITIYYDAYTNASGFKYGKLTSASGSVTNFNSGFRFGHATVTLGSVGNEYPNQRVTYNSYSSSWSFAAPSGWGYNQMGNGFCAIGSSVTAYISRDGSTMYPGTYQCNVG